MYGSNSGARQNGNGQFGNHTHIQTNAIAFFNAVLLQYMGKRIHAFVQLLVTYVLNGGIGIIGLENDGILVGINGKMSVDTILSNIELGTVEPSTLAGIEISTPYGVPRLPPRKMGGYFGPKAIGIVNAALVIGMVL